MNFIQAMIVPTMVSMGMGSLLVAQDLAMVEVSYAATAASPSPAAGGAAPGSRPPGKGKLGAPQLAPPNLGRLSPEFAGQGPGGVPIRAVTETELTIKAVEVAGREDPFMALVPPAPNAIVPPVVDFGPIAVTPIPPMPTPGPLPSLKPLPLPVTPIAVTPPRPLPKPKPIKKEDLSFAGDRAPSVGEPQWLVRGIMSTGFERVSLLEGRDENLHARVGDVLSDGSRIEAISNRGVTFIRSGRRFVKLIGGIL